MVELSSGDRAVRPVNRPRKIWIAIVLHLLQPGFGQFYNGKFVRALVFFLGMDFLFAIGAIVTAITESPIVFFISIILWIIGWWYILIDSIIITSKQKQNYYQAKFNNAWWKYLAVLVIFGAITSGIDIAITEFVIENFREPSASMEDTIIVGDFMSAKKCGYDSIEQNDIVIFKYPLNQNIYYVKRCIAKGGQTVEIKDKEILIDGVPLIMPSKAKHIDKRVFPYHDNDHGGRRDNMPLTIIPERQIFVVGDNLDNSMDSRFFGPVDGDLIIAKLMFVYFSLEPNDKYHTGSSSIIKKLLYNIGHFPSYIRWNRIGIKL